MERRVRWTLEMGERVSDFLESHPFTDASFGSAVTRFEELLARVRALAVQEREGRLSRSGGVERQRALQARLRRELIRHLRHVGKAAAKVRPELAAKFQLGTRRVPNAVFLATANAIAADANTVRDLLVEHGMPPAMLDELAATVRELETVTREIRGGQSGHVGARADLLAVARELVKQAEVLTGLVNFAHRNDPELLAAWKSVRHVFGPTREKGVTTTGNGQAKSA